MCEFYFYRIGSSWMVQIERSGVDPLTFGGFQELEDAIEQARHDCHQLGCSPDFEPRIFNSKADLDLALATSGGQFLSSDKRLQMRIEIASRLSSLFSDLAEFMGTSDEADISSEIDRQLEVLGSLNEVDALTQA